LNFILLLVPVILSTLIWPVSRWVMLKDGRTDAYGFWISISGAIAAGFLGLAMGQSYSGQALWWVGLMIAFAFAVGFCLIINYCLKIGPTGPTVAANNMGLVGPVIVGLLWPTSRVFTLLIGAGLGLVVLALVGFGVGPTLSVANQQRMSSRWAILVFLGWLLAALSMTGQYIGSVLAPTQPLTLVSVFFAFAALILLPFMLRYRRAWFRKNEFIGGLVQGPCQAVSIYVSLLALQRMGAQIVFPVTVLAPVMAVLLLSGFVYKERLHPITWISCVVGVSGLALLALSR
jgi:multidrug transporter EmrE-like cation transporter